MEPPTAAMPCTLYTLLFIRNAFRKYAIVNFMNLLPNTQPNKNKIN